MTRRPDLNVRRTSALDGKMDGVMTETDFWHLIDQSRDAVGGDLDEHGPALERLLEGRSREDLEAFARLFEVFEWQPWTRCDLAHAVSAACMRSSSQSSR